MTRKESGTQFLLQPSREYSKTRLPYYGADYGQYDPCGFDDCFPTIAASAVHTRDRNDQPPNISFPDHGELWGIPWEYHVSEDSVYLSVQGVRFKYEFSKTIRLEEATVLIEYQLINLSSISFAYIWAAHPILAIQPGSKILFNEPVDSVLLDWSTDASIGQPGDRVPWPGLGNTRNPNLAIIPDTPAHYAMKVYTDELRHGRCGYRRADTGEKLCFEFNPQKIPYVGILLQYNGWLNTPGNASARIALQPSRGRPDSLQQAYTRNEHAELEAQGMDHWSLRISLAER